MLRLPTLARSSAKLAVSKPVTVPSRQYAKSGFPIHPPCPPRPPTAISPAPSTHGPLRRNAGVQSRASKANPASTHAEPANDICTALRNARAELSTAKRLYLRAEADGHTDPTASAAFFPEFSVLRDEAEDFVAAVRREEGIVGEAGCLEFCIIEEKEIVSESEMEVTESEARG